MIRTLASIAASVALLAAPASSVSAGKYDDFARCLAAKNVVMYSVPWCPHCAEQKKLFGDSFKYVRSVECNVKATRQIKDECKQLGIRKTPTWIFGDTDRQEGTLSLQELSEKSGCKLP